MEWLARYGLPVALGGSLSAWCFWRTGCWSWRSRILVAFARLVWLMQVLLLGLSGLVWLLHAVRWSLLVHLVTVPVGATAPSGLHHPEQWPVWGLFAVTIAATVLAVYVTETRRSPRPLQWAARGTFLLTALLLLVQMGMTSFALSPLFASSSSSSVLVVSAAPAAAASTDSVVGGPSLSAAFVNQVLVLAGSPAAGTGQALSDLSVQYHVDDAYALATFEHESTYGKYGAAAVNQSLGNIVCAGYPTCNGRFRWYASWAEGYADFYRLIAREYVGRGLSTIGSIIPVYAPSSENDTGEYIRSLRRAISAFRAGRLA